jgi:hypothetical protein
VPKTCVCFPWPVLLGWTLDSNLPGGRQVHAFSVGDVVREGKRLLGVKRSLWYPYHIIPGTGTVVLP